MNDIWTAQEVWENLCDYPETGLAAIHQVVADVDAEVRRYHRRHPKATVEWGLVVEGDDERISVWPTWQPNCLCRELIIVSYATGLHIDVLGVVDMRLICDPCPNDIRELA